MPAQRCLLYCLSQSNKILEFPSKTHTTFQINSWSAKNVVDIYSNTGISLFTYITNCQALVSAKFPWVNKVYFVWYEYFYSSFLEFSFAWKTFFHLLTFDLCVPLDLKWVSCRHHTHGPCFCIHSANQCLLVGAFNTLTFKVIINMSVLTATFLIAAEVFL